MAFWGLGFSLSWFWSRASAGGRTGCRSRRGHPLWRRSGCRWHPLGFWCRRRHRSWRRGHAQRQGAWDKSVRSLLSCSLSPCPAFAAAFRFSSSRHLRAAGRTWCRTCRDVQSHCHSVCTLDMIPILYHNGNRKSQSQTRVYQTENIADWGTASSSSPFSSSRTV